MLLDLGSRDTALEYAERGWAVLPLLPRKKDPHFDLAQRAYLSATTDQKLINFWFDYDDKINIGIACYQSGLVVFDIDYRNGGELLPEFEPTYTVQTGDGLHLYYTADSLMYSKVNCLMGLTSNGKVMLLLHLQSIRQEQPIK